jgi:hypothetical protein
MSELDEDAKCYSNPVGWWYFVHDFKPLFYRREDGFEPFQALEVR